MTDQNTQPDGKGMTVQQALRELGEYYAGSVSLGMEDILPDGFEEEDIVDLSFVSGLTMKGVQILAMNYHLLRVVPYEDLASYAGNPSSLRLTTVNLEHVSTMRLTDYNDL